MNNTCVCNTIPEQETSVRKRIKSAFHAVVKGHDEHRKRNAVTQQFIAAYLSAEKRGELVYHPAQEHFHNILYESVRKLVANICAKRMYSCNSEMDDMIQDCYSRILKRIGTFKHYKAKFSTWCTHVCRSALNSRYRSNIRYSSRIAEVENIDGLSVVGPEDMMLAKEITDTVKAIAKAHPKKRKILYAMFGNPKKKNFLLPSEVRVAEVARELNVSYSEVYAFHRDVVRPFFKEKFGESYEWIRDA